MSTILNTNGDSLQIPVVASSTFTFHIITAEWNSEITHALRDGAANTLLKAGVPKENIKTLSVPGTVELINAAAHICHSGKSDGVIIIGCVVRGDTPHFDYVCQHTTTGTAILNAEGETPVTFGILTVDNFRQAQQRAGGELGNKGCEAACAAVTMANLAFEM